MAKAIRITDDVRAVEFGGGLEVVFERQSTDAMGKKKWDEIDRARGDWLRLPTDVVMRLYAGWKARREERGAEPGEEAPSKADPVFRDRMAVDGTSPVRAVDTRFDRMAGRLG